MFIINEMESLNLIDFLNFFMSRMPKASQVYN